MNFGKVKKIFIVDDDALMSEALADYLLMQAPHTIHQFRTGEDCLKHIGDHPDIVILDYYLDAVDKTAANGMEILQTIKKYYPHTHVIMLSGQEKYAVAMQSIQKGAEQYVLKGQDSFEKIANLVKELE